MRQVYGNSMDTITTLLKAISDRHKSLGKEESRAIRTHKVRDDEAVEVEEEDEYEEKMDDFGVLPIVPLNYSWKQAIR